VHYACGDKEGRDRALTSATRTIVVFAVGVIGDKVAGPVVAVVAAVGAGAYYDMMTSVQSGGRQVNGLMRIANNPFKIKFWISGGIKILGDVCFGVGSVNTSKILFKKSLMKTVQKLFKNQAHWIIGLALTLNAGGSRL
jgi:hypothetical protein